MTAPAIASDARGAVYVEFLLVFLPVFLLFLAVVQLGLVYTARLVVQHASATAARAAVVVIDDDPRSYGGEPRGRVDPGGASGPDSPLQAFVVGTGVAPAAASPGGGARLRDIRSAASIPLLAVSPSAEQLEGEDSVRAAIGRGQARAAFGASRYNLAALAVTFPTAPGASSTRTEFGKREPITVRVSYLAHCAVPLVPALMCKSVAGLGPLLSADEAQQLDLGYLAGLANPRYLLLRGETTLPNQGADYRYAGEAR